MRLLDWNNLTNSDWTDNPSGYFLALTIAFGVLFVVSAIVYWRRSKLIRENAILRRVMRQACKAGMWTSGIGLFLALMRYIEFPYLSAPILMLLLVLSMIVIVGFFVYELSERYPLALFRLQESHLQRQFAPSGRARSEPQRARRRAVPVAGRRGKRRR